MFTNNSSLTP